MSAYILHKVKRVALAVLGGEPMSFAESSHMAYTIKYDLQGIINRRVPVSMYTDIVSLFGIIMKSNMTTKKRLMKDLKCVKKSYKHMEIGDIAYFKVEYNIADALIKDNKNYIWISNLSTTQLDHPIGQWTVRWRMIHKKDSKRR